MLDYCPGALELNAVADRRDTLSVQRCESDAASLGVEQILQILGLALDGHNEVLGCIRRDVDHAISHPVVPDRVAFLEWLLGEPKLAAPVREVHHDRAHPRDRRIPPLRRPLNELATEPAATSLADDERAYGISPDSRDDPELPPVCHATTRGGEAIEVVHLGVLSEPKRHALQYVHLSRESPLGTDVNRVADSRSQFAEPGTLSSTSPTHRPLPRRAHRGASSYRRPDLGARRTVRRVASLCNPPTGIPAAAIADP